MTALHELAQAFVNLWVHLKREFGAVFALADSALQAARRNYLQEKMVCVC